MSNQNAVVGIYKTHTEAEDAVKELQKSGFEMKKLSVVGKDYHTEENVVGFYNAGDRMKYWGKLGAFWGGLVGDSFRRSILRHSRVGAACGGGTVGQLDSRGTGRRRRGGRSDRSGRWTV
jgi:uncharacterized membrane protein